MRAYAKNDADLEKRLSAYLKAEIKAAGITYAQLIERLERHGYPDVTIDSLKKKLMRGQFSAGFFLATLAALGVTQIALKDV